MYFFKPGEPTELKRVIYLSAAVALGLLLSFLAHAWMEIKYLSLLAKNGQVAAFYHGCALPAWLQLVLLLLGAVGGFMLGRFWWRIIYVEKRYAKKIN